MRKLINFTLVTLFVLPLRAQDLAAGIEEATSELQSVVAPIKGFLFILAGIVGIYGGIRVYTKHQNGDQDTYKAMGQFGFGIIFLIAAGFIIDAVFDIG